MMAVEVNFEQGAIGPMHNHPHEQLTYVLSGEFEFTIGEEKQIVTAGDTLYKAPHVMHGCICLKPGTLLDTFTPVRDDIKKALNQRLFNIVVTLLLALRPLSALATDYARALPHAAARCRRQTGRPESLPAAQSGLCPDRLFSPAVTVKADT